MTDVWDEDFDSSSSQFYFVHRASKETRWKLPDPTALARQSAEWHGLEDASTGRRSFVLRLSASDPLSPNRSVRANADGLGASPAPPPLPPPHPSVAGPGDEDVWDVMWDDAAQRSYFKHRATGEESFTISDMWDEFVDGRTQCGYFKHRISGEVRWSASEDRGTPPPPPPVVAPPPQVAYPPVAPPGPDLSAYLEASKYQLDQQATVLAALEREKVELEKRLHLSDAALKAAESRPRPTTAAAGADGSALQRKLDEAIGAKEGLAAELESRTAALGSERKKKDALQSELDEAKKAEEGLAAGYLAKEEELKRAQAEIERLKSAAPKDSAAAPDDAALRTELQQAKDDLSRVREEKAELELKLKLELETVKEKLQAEKSELELKLKLELETLKETSQAEKSELELSCKLELEKAKEAAGIGDASKLAEIAAELERVKVEKDEQKAALEAEAEAQKAEQAKQVEEVQAAMSKAAEAEKAELKREFEREASVALCTRTLGRIMKKSESRAFRAWSQFVLDAKVAEGRCVDKMSERFGDRKRARLIVPPRVFAARSRWKRRRPPSQRPRPRRKRSWPRRKRARRSSLGKTRSGKHRSRRPKPRKLRSSRRGRRRSSKSSSSKRRRCCACARSNESKTRNRTARFARGRSLCSTSAWPKGGALRWGWGRGMKESTTRGMIRAAIVCYRQREAGGRDAGRHRQG